MESKDNEESNTLNPVKTSSSIPNPEERLKSSPASSSSSSLSSEFTFEDPLPADKFGSGNSSPKGEEPDQGSQPPAYPRPESVSSSPDSSPRDGSPLQSPPLQVMERPNSDGSGYRIPSYVFARSKYSTPMKWSVASNESLFSIQNMSFTRDQFNWVLKSGEPSYIETAGKPEDLPKPGQLPSPCEDPSISAEQVAYSIASSPPSPVDKSPAKESGHEEAGDVGTMTGAPAASGTDDANSPGATEKEEFEVQMNDQRNAKPSFSDDAPPLTRQDSDASVKSFAFPVLTAEADRGSSVTPGADHATELQQKNEREEPPEVHTATPDATTQTSWFPCFSLCCQCCSRKEIGV